MAWLFLARAGIVRVRRLSTRGLRTTTGATAGFMALNTEANLTSPHPLERWMGAATFAIGLAGAVLAADAHGCCRLVRPRIHSQAETAR